MLILPSPCVKASHSIYVYLCGIAHLRIQKNILSTRCCQGNSISTGTTVDDTTLMLIAAVLPTTEASIVKIPVAALSLMVSSVVTAFANFAIVKA